MASKVRNFAFVGIVCCALLTVFAYIAFTAINGRGDNAQSYLEGRSLQEFPDLSASTLSEGTFQSDFEQFAADSMPKRMGVLIYNAAAQRSAIELANAPFGFSCYPTYFGSSYALAPGWDSVLQIPKKKEVVEGKFQRALAGLGSVMEANPDADWHFALVDRNSVSASSPLYGYVADAEDYAYVIDLAKGILPESCDCINLETADTADFYEKYFLTDHHWRVQGAYDAYCRIADSLGFDPVDLQLVNLYDGPFYGSGDRNGVVDTVNDSVAGLYVDLGSDATVETNGSAASLAILGYAYRADGLSYVKKYKFSNSYGDCFHGDYGLIHITNPDASSEGSLLIVGDSYTNNCEALYAMQYRDVYVLDPRHYAGSVSEFMSQHEFDDSLVLLCSETLESETFSEAIRG